ncbi:hypothetical protein GCM10027174_41800 [Salinifilum aidingensis]
MEPGPRSSERNGLSDDHIAAALRGYAGGSAGPGGAAESAGAAPAPGRGRSRPPAAGLLLYALLLGLAAGACCAAVTLL